MVDRVIELDAAAATLDERLAERRELRPHDRVWRRRRVRLSATVGAFGSAHGSEAAE